MMMKHSKATLYFLFSHVILAVSFSTHRPIGPHHSLTKISSVATDTNQRPVSLIGETCERGGTILDEDAMILQQNFPITPEDLISRAKYALRKDSGVLETSLWANDFEFCAPYIGPLPKEEFLDAANGFDIYSTFPDFDNRYSNFSVDPLEPGRVWFFVRLLATDTGGLFGKEPTNRTVQLPPQVFSFKFDEEGLIRELTVGYSIDRRQGDTGGVGGMFGLFYGVGQGLPFREGQPIKPSLKFRLFTKLGNAVSRFSKRK